MQSLAPRQDFIGVEDATYLYTGAESAPLKSQEQALGRYLQERANGELGGRSTSGPNNAASSG